ncbi:MAG: MBL fold metallo-hydrolase [Candidatus Eisenbacteria bacterium]|nr:MBL fold metallo-hydrolase [Candidatus Eisenbacteria bacterium]
MRIAFWGAVRSVTGSRHLLDIQGRRLLLDCGLFQGHREEAEARNRNLPFQASGIDAVLLSHAHIDHSGNLPMLVKNGFDGPIHSTPATADLLDPMLRDSAHIQERDVEFVNRRQARQGKRPRQPIYTSADVERTLPLLEPQPYGRPFDAVPGATVRFLDAGHILGSALTVLDLREGGRDLRLCFTGDLGRENLPIIRDPESVTGVDTLVIESTYGSRDHEETDSIEGRLVSLLARVRERRGKVIVPAFAVGRTQEMVYMLARLFESGRVPPMPVFIDSPLAVDVTAIFRAHPECYDAETLALLNESRKDPFGFQRMHYVRLLEESKALNTREGPMIVISASGMCEGGRVLHHLRNSIEDPRNLVLIIGFQAENTLGRRLAEKSEEVRIFGETFRLRAEVEVIDAFSAHADREELLAWATSLTPRPRRVFVVHGEEEQSISFAAALSERGFDNAIVPEMGKEYVL